ncbi:permease-like cell division protein FtsX [Tomitella biformata]|uniref:permease-like cell division protein FtsX n=1 Tax=Tomitella biformata TaxID=630403 RepID=UPI0004663C84|nr:permease-like cell division protein FtsX [Tomitella biformata]
MRVNFIISEVLSGLRRNITMTIAMVITTAISLGLLGSGLLVVRMSNETQALYMDRVEIEVYLTLDVTLLDPTCSDTTCATLRSDLENTPGVESVRFVDQEAANEMFKETFKNDSEMLALLDPDTLTSSFRLKVPDPDRFAEIRSEFSERPGVDSIRTEKELVDQLISVLNGVRNAAFAVALVQGLGAILLMANMIQIAAYSRKTEVGVMRLVGASRWFTQLPFLLEAVVAALIGAGLAIGGLFVAKNIFLDDVLAEIYRSNTFAQITNADIGLISPILIGLGVVFAGLTAWVTLRLYVRE